MKVRGDRECTNCGARWSYYETGEIACPECGSLQSVGTDTERKRHTDAPATLDLTEFRGGIADQPATESVGDTLPGLEGVATELNSTLREYLRKRGFVRADELLPLDETYLAARELLEAIDIYRRIRNPDAETSLYVLELLQGADVGDRPDPDDVPASMVEARGMAAATAVDTYRKEMTVVLEDQKRNATETGTSSGTATVDVKTVLSRLRDHCKRIEALQGDVPPTESADLVTAAREVGTYIREDDLDSLARAHDRVAESL